MRLAAPPARVDTLDRLIDVRRDVRKLRDSQAPWANAVAPEVRLEVAFIRRGELEPVIILVAGPVLAHHVQGHDLQWPSSTDSEVVVPQL